MHAWTNILKLTNTKNLDGGLVARMRAGLPFFVSEGMQFALVPPVLDAPRYVTVSFAEADGVDGGLVYFDEVEDVDTAEMIVGCHCLLRTEDLPNDAYGYTAQDGPSWEGWEVYDASEGYIGHVCGIKEMPGQIMMEVDRQSCDTLLIPLVDEFIVEVDEDAQRVTFDLPNGLLSL